MLGRVIVAVDYACGEAESYSDERFVRYCWEELFPILEAEREKAAAEEGSRRSWSGRRPPSGSR
jgi:hypothetical protein